MKKTCPDAALDGVDALQPRRKHARRERRLPGEIYACSLEAKLWGGFSAWATVGLEALLADERARADERGYAAWALAGWLAFLGMDWHRVAKLADQARAAAFPAHLGPVLLESSSLQRERRFFEARRVLRLAINEQPNAVDLQLAYANAWLDGPDLRRLAWINRALSGRGLAALELKDSTRPLSLDNIVVSDLRQLDAGATPKVSVIVPLFNTRATVTSALDSVLRQTWGNIEVLVVDDCSSDGSFELARAIADRDERVVLLRHATNCGTYAARNTGLARATGELVTAHDADDWSHPQKLALQVQALLEAPACQASVSYGVHCSSLLVFSSWRPQATWVHCNPSSLMFRRHLVDTLGYWDSVSVGADAEFYYRILGTYGDKAIKEVLLGVPLAFTGHCLDSLTQRSSTHLRSLYYGLRREYLESADDWHKQIRHEGCSPESATFSGRPFPVPAAMLRKLPDEMVACLIVADFSADFSQADHVESCLRHMSELTGPLAMFHLPDVTRPALGRVSGTVRTLMRDRGVLAVLPGQRVRCSCLLIWTHSGLTLPLDDPPAIEALDQAVVLVGQPVPQNRTSLPGWICTTGKVRWYDQEAIRASVGWAVLQSALFDPDWYLRRYPDLMEAGVEPLRHFLAHGLRENRDPGPDFTSSGYRASCLGLGAQVPPYEGVATAESPLVDYVVRGKGLGFAPLSVFEGAMLTRANRPTVLLCGHLAGPKLFGAELSLLDVLGALNQLRFNVVVALPGVHHSAYFAEIRRRATRITVLPYGWWKNGFVPCQQTVEHFRKLMQAHKVDLVYVNTLVLDEPMVAASTLQLPVVVHVRELPGSDPMLCRVLGASAEQIRQRLLTHADGLIANSRRVLRYLQGESEDTARLPMHVVPNIVHCSRFDLPFPAQNDGFNVAMISSNEAKKGVADFVEVARQLATLAPGIRCLLIGPETPVIAALRAQQREGVVRDNVVFPGYAATAQAALAEAHVVVSLSSVEESFGRTVLEAMAARRPVVCYNRGALSELVVEGETGFLVPPGDVTTVAARVQLLFQDQQLWRRMGEAARTHAARNYDAAALKAALGGALARFL